jgi:hypothetical protein
MAKCAYCKADTELYDGGTPICVGCSEDRENKRKPPAFAQDFHSALYQEVVAATARVNSATADFYLTMEAPSGLPHPDGTQRIHNASNRLTAARKDMMRAYSRFNDFVREGIVPEDLKRHG